MKNNYPARMRRVYGVEALHVGGQRSGSEVKIRGKLKAGGESHSKTGPPPLSTWFWTKWRDPLTQVVMTKVARRAAFGLKAYACFQETAKGKN